MNYIGQMKIVILDGFTLNPGDLSWKGLQGLGDCDIHDRTPADLVLPRCKNAEAVFTNNKADRLFDQLRARATDR